MLSGPVQCCCGTGQPYTGFVLYIISCGLFVSYSVKLKTIGALKYSSGLVLALSAASIYNICYNNGQMLNQTFLVEIVIHLFIQYLKPYNLHIYYCNLSERILHFL